VPLAIKNLVSYKPQWMAFCLLLVYMLLGAVFFKLFEHWTWVEAFYFAVSTMTTVGYGDFNPAIHAKADIMSDFTLVCTMLYIVLGVGVIGACLGLLAQHILGQPLQHRSLSGTILVVTAIFALLIGSGAVGICLIEGWDFIHGAYWAVVTISTVGYGYKTPEHDAGRLFACFFMLVGVSSAAHCFSMLAALPLDAHRKGLEQRVISQYGDELLEDELWELAAGNEMRELGLSESDAYVRRNEFCLAMLVRMEKVSHDELRRCQNAFDKLDVTRTGKLTRHDLQIFQRRRNLLNATQ